MMNKPNKFLGQHWLINPKIHKAMVEAGEVISGDIILEVGSGTGLLTKHLAQTGAQIIAIEKDPRLARELTDKYKNDKNVKIMEGDILKNEEWQIGLAVGSYKAIGNIPYYLTSRLIQSFLDPSIAGWPTPKLLIFMVQKEVALRITATPPKMNLLGLSVQFYANAQMVQSVSKGNFRPSPQVDSAIIKIAPQNLSSTKKQLAPFLFKIAHAGFAGKRKQLLHSLSAGLELPKAEIETAMAKANIAGQRRPETLNVPEWLNLSLSLSSLLSVD